MHPRVTAIVVAHNGADHLERTLAALRAQTHAPDAIIAVDCASRDNTHDILAAFGPTQLVSSPEPLAFGAAIGHAVRVLDAPDSDNQWLWLLAQDSAPEPDALASLLAAVEVAPSVAVAGPKQMDWTDSGHIRQFGETITPFGTTVALVQNELDQAQHDVSSDVLAVSAGGMLVRHTLWNQLGGFDPGLPVVDDALDFCVRTRLAGHRIVLVPEARVTSDGAGVAGPTGSRKGSARRKRLRLNRRAQLHRRLVYAPAPALPLHWLTLVPLAILRSLVHLVRKQPGAIPGEFAAAFGAAFAGIRVFRARRRLRKSATVGWAAVDALRMPFATLRRRNSLERDAARVRHDGERTHTDFFSAGGAWTVLAMAVVGIGLNIRLLGAEAIGGGGLLPLSTPATLWQNIGYGWRDLGLGFVGAADPFAAVLAVLGSLTFWAPSLMLVLLYLAAMPLAALGAWFLTTRFTDRVGLRAFAAIAWALSPTLLVSLSDGRPAAILTHLLLPWLFYAGYRAKRSWSAAAVTGLLAAATIACAPILAPALAIVWAICLLVSGRRLARWIAVALPTAALFAPLVWTQGFERGNWFALLADPGLPVLGTRTDSWQLLAGVPGDGLAAWNAYLATFGQTGISLWVAGGLMAPLAALAVIALFLRRSVTAASALMIALLGFGTAVLAGQLLVAFAGSQPVTVFAGTGVSLMWLGLIIAATVGLASLGRIAPVPAVVALLCAVVAVAPLAVTLPMGQTDVSATSGRTLPAVVTAEAAGSPRTGTLVLTPRPDGSLLVGLERGAGATLDAQSTLATTRTTLGPDQVRLSTLGVNLASQSAYDVEQELADLAVGYVLLRPAPREPELENRITLALDGNALLTPVGDTAVGKLWSHELASTETPVSSIPADAGGQTGSLVLLLQGVVVALMLLLAFPTGAVREQDVRAVNPKRKRRRQAKRQAAQAAVGGPAAAANERATNERAGDARGDGESVAAAPLGEEPGKVSAAQVPAEQASAEQVPGDREVTDDTAADASLDATERESATSHA